MKPRRRTYLPSINTKREYESTINLYRVDRGLTWNALSKAVKAPISAIYQIAVGSYSPVYEYNTKGHHAGELKPVAKRLATVLGASLEELYPRYICLIEKDRLNDYIPEQIIECTMSIFSQKVAKRYTSYIKDDEFLVDSIQRVLAKLKEHERNIIIWRFWEGLELEECGRRLHITRQGAAQVEIKALGKLKNSPSLVRSLEGFIE